MNSGSLTKYRLVGVMGSHIAQCGCSRPILRSINSHSELFLVQKRADSRTVSLTPVTAVWLEERFEGGNATPVADEPLVLVGTDPMALIASPEYFKRTAVELPDDARWHALSSSLLVTVLDETQAVGIRRKWVGAILQEIAIHFDNYFRNNDISASKIEDLLRLAGDAAVQPSDYDRVYLFEGTFLYLAHRTDQIEALHAFLVKPRFPEVSYPAFYSRIRSFAQAQLDRANLLTRWNGINNQELDAPSELVSVTLGRKLRTLTELARNSTDSVHLIAASRSDFEYTAQQPTNKEITESLRFFTQRIDKRVLASVALPYLEPFPSVLSFVYVGPGTAPYISVTKEMVNAIERIRTSGEVI